MPFFSKLFGGKSKPQPVVSTISAIDQNRNTIDMLEKKIAYITSKNITPNLNKAKELAKVRTEASKQQAMKILKKTKLYQAQVSKMEAQIMNLEGIRIALEGAAITQDVFNSMTTGANTLGSILPSSEKIDNVFADTEEAIERANEVTEMLSGNLAVGNPIDDDDLESELAELAGDEPESVIPEVPIDIPSAPSTIPSFKDNSSGNVETIDDLIAFVNN